MAKVKVIPKTVVIWFIIEQLYSYNNDIVFLHIKTVVTHRLSAKCHQHTKWRYGQERNDLDHEGTNIEKC